MGPPIRDRSQLSRRDDQRGSHGAQSVAARECRVAQSKRNSESRIGFLRGRTRPANALITRFIADHRGRREGADGLRWGVESICTQLSELGVPIAPSTFYDRARRKPSSRAVRDEALKQHISRVHIANGRVSGARKVWSTLNNEGIAVARCTVERLMAELGLTGAAPIRDKRAANTAPGTARPAGPGRRRSGPSAPDRLWVVGLTRLSTCSGFAYVAFVTDAYARRILGWRVDTTTGTSMMFDAIEHAVSTRQVRGTSDVKNVVHQTDERSYHTSIRFAQQLATSGVQHLVGAIGTSDDNSVAATVNGLYQTAMIGQAESWRTVADLELATARWVDWFNHRRPSEYCGGIPPAEFETAYHVGHRSSVDSGQIQK